MAGYGIANSSSSQITQPLRVVFTMGTQIPCNLHALLLALQTLYMSYGMIIHVIHISCKSMIK